MNWFYAFYRRPTLGGVVMFLVAAGLVRIGGRLRARWDLRRYLRPIDTRYHRKPRIPAMSRPTGSHR